MKYRKLLWNHQPLTDFWRIGKGYAHKLAATHQLTTKLNLSVHYDEKTFELIPKIAEYEIDRFGRKRPKSIRKKISLARPTNANTTIRQALQKLFNDYVNPHYLIRRITITAEEVVEEQAMHDFQEYKQTNLFIQEKVNSKIIQERDNEQRVMNCQNAILKIKNRFGANSIYKAMDIKKDSMTLRRNQQIGGHLA